jgi:predicted phosphoribosyltransferase
MNEVLPLADRAEAGRLLARRLMHLSGDAPLVLALPRGGVPVAYPVARALGAELDLLLVRKLGAPGNPEFAIGAVVDGAEPQLVINPEMLDLFVPEGHYLEQERGVQLAELERQRRIYLGNQHAPCIGGRTVIIVDDGIATGATMTAAIRGVRQAGPARLVLAIPVAPRSTAEALRRLCDEMVVLAMPDPFLSVGRHYRDFSQTSDAEVIRLLARARDKAGH